MSHPHNTTTAMPILPNGFKREERRPSITLLDLQLRGSGHPEEGGVEDHTPLSPASSGDFAYLTTKLGDLNLLDSADPSLIVSKGFSLSSFATLLMNKEVFKLETHFKWMLELDGGGALDRTRLLTLKEKMTSWVSESDKHLSTCQLVTQKLLLAVYTSFLDGDTNETIDYFDQAYEIIQNAKNEGESEEQVEVYRYFTVIGMTIVTLSARLLKTPEEGEKRLTMDKFIGEVNYFLEQAEKMFGTSESKLGGPVSKATLLALKGQLANQLGYTNSAVKLFEQAVKRHPECFDWQHHLYTSIRKSRREFDFQKPPSRKEVETCKKAHQLRPDYWLGLLSLAQLYEDINKCIGFCAEKCHNLMEIITCLKQARKLAPGNVTVHLKLAEAYCLLSRDEDVQSENIAAASELFTFAKKTWPDNSQVLHKIGKFYSNIKHDAKTALEYYKKAVTIDATNFPCLMDYIRLKSRSLNTSEMFQLIGEFLPEYKYKQTYHVKLTILQGVLYWHQNDPFSAILSWLSTFEFTEEADKSNLEGYLKSSLLGRGLRLFDNATYGRNVPIDLLKQQMHLHRQKLLASLPDCEKKIMEFQKFFESINSNSNWRSGKGPNIHNGNTGDGDNHWRRPEQNARPRNNYERQPSTNVNLADGDGDWRRQKPAPPPLAPSMHLPLVDLRVHLDANQGRSVNVVDLRDHLEAKREADRRREQTPNFNQNQSHQRLTNDGNGYSRIQHDEQGRWRKSGQDDANAYYKETRPHLYQQSTSRSRQNGQHSQWQTNDYKDKNSTWR